MLYTINFQIFKLSQNDKLSTLLKEKNNVRALAQEK